MNLKKTVVKEAILTGVGLVGSAVNMVLSAAHTKKDMIDIRRERWAPPQDGPEPEAEATEEEEEE